mgnify:CR=1 FL=1
MIQQETVLNVADNTGAKKILCIQVMGGSYRNMATLVISLPHLLKMHHPVALSRKAT